MDLATIGLTVDTGPMKAGTAALQQFGQAAAQTSTTVTATGQAVSSASQGIGAATQGIASAQAALAAAAAQAQRNAAGVVQMGASLNSTIAGVAASAQAAGQAGSVMDRFGAAVSGVGGQLSQAAASAQGVAATFAGKLGAAVSGVTAAFGAMGSQARTATSRLGQVGQQATASGAAMSGAMNNASGSVAGLGYQFNDIGVMLASGQNPLMLAIQQGTQVSQVLGPMGARGAVSALGGAFLSVFNPTSLAIIGTIAALGYLVQWLRSTGDEARSAGDVVDDFSNALDDYRGYADTARASTADLRGEFGRFAAEMRAHAEWMARAALSDAMGTVDASAFTQSLDPVMAAMAEFEEARDAFNRENALLTKGLTEPGSVAGFERNMVDARDRMVEAADAVGLTAGELRQMQAAFDAVDAASATGDLTAVRNALSAALGMMERFTDGEVQIAGPVSEAGAALHDALTAATTAVIATEGATSALTASTASVAQATYAAIPSLRDLTEAYGANAGAVREAMAAQNALAVAQQQAGFDALVQDASDVRDAMKDAGTETMGLSMALGVASGYNGLDEQARSALDLAQAIAEAAGGADRLEGEALAVYQALLQAVPEAAELALRTGAADAVTMTFAERWATVTANIAAARGEVGLFGGALQQVQGFMSGLAGAAGDFLESFDVPSGLASSLAGAGDGMAASRALIKEREGWQPTGTWDVNAYRAGYGSDTVTLSDGSVKAVTQGMAVSVADANRDLTRRIAEFQAGVIREVGADKWASLLPAQQAALTSIAYNYGNLPDRVAAAVRDGSTDAVAASIVALGSDNDGVNRDRRNQEAAIYGSGLGVEQAALAQDAEAARAATEATRAQEQAVRDAAQAQAEQVRLTEAARSAYDGLVASIDPAAAASQQLAEAQATVNDAVGRGLISAAEGATVMAAFAAQQQDAADALLATTDGTAAFQGAIADAAMSAAEFGQAMGGMVVGAVDSVAGAFGDFIAGGLRDFGGFVDSILGSFQSMLSQMIAMAAKNQIMISMGMTGVPGMGGGLTGATSALGTALGGATAGLAGLATAVGAIAVPVAAAIGVVKFFTGSTKELDAGLRLTAEGMDLLVESFSKTETSRFFGLSKSTSTDYDPASADVADPIEAAFAEIAGSVADMAAVLGRGEDAFADFTSSVTISTKGMSDEEAAAAVTDALAGVSDEMAALALSGVAASQAGETATQTLARVSNELVVVSEGMAALGLDLGDFFANTTAAALEMANALGGADTFAAAADAYFKAFYTIDEQAAAAQRQLNEGFAAAGVGDIPETDAEFRALVERLLAAGEAGHAATVMGLTPLWESLQELEEQAAAAGGAVRDAGYEDRIAIQRRIWELEGNTAALRADETAQLDATAVALQERLYALEDEQAAAEAAKAVADERLSLEERYYTAVGDTAALAAMARAEIDGANLAYYDTVVAAENAAKALDEAQAAMEALDPSAFVSRYAFQRAQADAAAKVANNPYAPGSNVVPLPAPSGTTTEQQAAQQVADMAALLKVARDLLAVTQANLPSIATYTRGTRDQLRIWEDVGMPEARTA